MLCFIACKHNFIMIQYTRIRKSTPLSIHLLQLIKGLCSTFYLPYLQVCELRLRDKVLEIYLLCIFDMGKLGKSECGFSQTILVKVARFSGQNWLYLSNVSSYQIYLKMSFILFWCLYFLRIWKKTPKMFLWAV